MNIEVAINLVDTLYFEKNNQHINSVQMNLLRGVWLDYSYEEIANICYCSISNIKMIGSTFWTELSQILGEKVTKKTVRAILESYHEDHKTGKIRKTLHQTEKQYILPKNAETKIDLPLSKSDLWTSSEILWRMTERLDDSLKKIDSICDTDLNNIKSFSEKLKLLYHLSQPNYLFAPTFSNIIDFFRNLINNFSHKDIVISLFEEPILFDYDLSINILFDEKILHYLFKQLLINALQYSPADSIITIDINIENQKGIFTITDEGIGIPTNELENIFEPFYCGSNAKEKCGDGLGLTIVEKSVRLHQGEICVSSQIEEGSIFTIILPIT